MADSQGATRMNISVPADVKREMDAVTASVNWSAVAVEGFRAKLLELRSTQEPSNMTEVIARLKAAAKVEENESIAEGSKAGEAWAKKQAKPRELRRLDAATDETTGGVHGLFIGRPGHLGHAGGIAEIITGKSIDSDDFNLFWSGILDDTTLVFDDDFMLGFVMGALEVWAAVEPHI